MSKNPCDKIPKIIWFMWLQGIENAPYLVKKCYESWRINNPDWQINFLDEHNLSKYVILEVPPKISKKLMKAHLSDLARLKLLSEHGGVWVDATCFCIRPLDDWLGGYIRSGFFAFHQSGSHKIMSNWFLVSERNNPIVVKLHERLVSYWESNDLSNKGMGKSVSLKLFDIIFNRNSRTTRFWFSFLVTKVFRVYPYSVFHYLFAKLIFDDPECSSVWLNTEKFSADIPHKIQESGMISPLTTDIKKEIDEKSSPLYKLSRKFPSEKYSEGCILHYLFEESSLVVREESVKSENCWINFGRQPLRGLLDEAGLRRHLG